MNARSKHEGAEHAVKEHAMLIERRDAEVVEDEHEDEDVVDGERLLDEIPGEKLQPRLPAGLRPDD